MCKHRYTTTLLASTLFLISLGLFAADKPTAIEKIAISADHMQMDIESGDSSYFGHVRISQGQLLLTGDTVTLEQGNDEIERLTVTGNPARYNHVTEKGEKIEAESKTMVYTASKNQLVMTDDARLTQPDSTLKSQKIVYDTEKKIVIAGDKPTGWSDDTEENQRVNIILTPKNPKSE